jgi:hypothetical protein
MRLSAAPSQVVLEPDGIAILRDYEAGEWCGFLPDLHVHAIIGVEDEAEAAQLHESVVAWPQLVGFSK